MIRQVLFTKLQIICTFNVYLLHCLFKNVVYFIVKQGRFVNLYFDDLVTFLLYFKIINLRFVISTNYTILAKIFTLDMFYEF